jgi:allantoinase
MSDYDLVLVGDVVTPGGVLADGWVAVRNGRIAAIGSGDAPAAKQHRDARGNWILPGVIDGQTHAGSATGFDGLEPTTRAAAAGGVTTIVDMPYDNPDPVNTPELLQQKVDAVERLAHTDVALYATLAPDAPPEHLDTLADTGAAAVKLSLYESHPTRFPRIPKDRILAFLERARDRGLPVGLHNEDQELVHAHVQATKDSGRTGPEAHHPSRPPVAEIVATQEFLELGRASGGHVHIVHFSQARGYELVADARAEGVQATAELCVHYLVFDEGDVREKGNVLKVNPPIRPNEKDAIWEHLLTGNVNFVSSDHGSWPLDRKTTDDVFQAAAGIPGLQTLLPAFHHVCVERGAPVTHLARFLAEGPAKFFGLWPRKGALQPGADADITVLAPTPTRFDASATHDGLNWSPYDGMTFPSQVSATYVRGELVFADDEVTSAPGHGTYVPRGKA